jgi:hypothetical protein
MSILSPMRCTSARIIILTRPATKRYLGILRQRCLQRVTRDVTKFTVSKLVEPGARPRHSPLRSPSGAERQVRSMSRSVRLAAAVRLPCSPGGGGRSSKLFAILVTRTL